MKYKLVDNGKRNQTIIKVVGVGGCGGCLLYTSDAADDP